MMPPSAADCDPPRLDNSNLVLESDGDEDPFLHGSESRLKGHQPTRREHDAVSGHEGEPSSVRQLDTNSVLSIPTARSPAVGHWLDVTVTTCLDPRRLLPAFHDAVGDTDLATQSNDHDQTVSYGGGFPSTQDGLSSGTLTRQLTPTSDPRGALDNEHFPRHVGLSKEYKLPPRLARGRKPKAGTLRPEHPKSYPLAPKTKPQRRGALIPEVRKSAALKRQQRSVCIICHFKKGACTTDRFAPEGTCLRCKHHRMPCVRYHIAETTLYRDQVAPYWVFSQRWKKMELVDITNWASSDTRVVEISVKYLHAPYKARVRRFVPEPGDMMAEQWTTKDGQVVHYPLPPYGFASMEETATSIGQMLEREVGNFIDKTVGCHSLAKGSLVWETFFAAFKRAATAPSVQEQQLLFDTLRLWVICRINSNFEHIVSDEKLGISPVDDPASPFHGSVPITGVMTAQLECIYSTEFLRPLSKRVLRTLVKLFEARDPAHWHTIYLVLFALLHSCSMTTRRDMEYAATLGLPVPFCNPESIKQQNAGSTTLLAHYHQVLKGALPFKLALDGNLGGYKSTGTLNADDISFITRSARLAAESKPSWDQIRKSGAWENDCFWISQLYDQEWKPEKMD